MFGWNVSMQWSWWQFVCDADYVLRYDAHKVMNTHRQVEFDCIHWCMEGPGKLVLPQGLHHHLEQKLQLIGLALWPVGTDALRGYGVTRGLGLPLAAAAARHLRCVQAVPHSVWVEHGLVPRRGSWSWSRGRGSGVGRTPVQSWPRHRLHWQSTADPIALLAGLSKERKEHTVSMCVNSPQKDITLFVRKSFSIVK